MVILVMLADSLQDQNRILLGRLVYHDRLKTALQCAVFFYIFAKLIHRRGTNDLNIPACEARFQDVCRVYSTLSASGADDRMDFIYEKHHVSRFLQFFEDPSHPFLELTPIFGAGDEVCHVQLNDTLVFEHFRYFFARDFARKPFDHRRFPNPRVTDENGVVLGPSSQYLGNTSDFPVPSDNRVDGLTPESFRHLLEELGPTFVKAGQILSMRSEILPQSFCEELAKLRTNVEPMDRDLLLETLRSEYDKPIEEIFDAIDDVPLGSASVAQVHKARLVGGELVAIKEKQITASEYRMMQIIYR